MEKSCNKYDKMSMEMKYARQEGLLDKDKILRRFENVLQLVYMQSFPTEDGGYRIPKKVFESVQTELDFNPPNEEKGCEMKKRYRQRDTYRFWKDFLSVANIGNQTDAKEYLMRIFTLCDNKGVYGSMTHSRYALETMMLALDDLYGTDNTIITPNVFLSNKVRRKKRGVVGEGIALPKKECEDDIPF